MLSVAAALVFAAGVSATPAAPAPPLLDLRVVRQDGTTATLREVARGTPTVFAFWASYCPPCQAEVPALNRAAELWRDRGFHLRIVGVAIETDAERVHAARKAWGIRYDVVRVAPGQDDLLERLLPRGLPAAATVLKDDARLTEHILDEAELDRMIPRLLGVAQ